MKFRKKHKTMLILLAVIAALLVCYFGLIAYNRHQEKAAALAKEESTVYLTDLENITGIRYDAGNGEMAFVKEDDTWYVADDKDFPLSQNYPEQIAESFGKLKAVRELEDGDTLSDYGLDEPAYTVELTVEDGTQTKILIGNTAGEDYYATVDDTGKVYTIESTVLSDLQYSLDDMALLDTLPSIGSGNLVRETITAPDSTVTYDSENNDDAEAIATVAGGLGALSLDTAVNYSAEDSELAQYGLDKDSRTTVEAVYKNDDIEQTLTLYIGNESGQGTNYVMVEDSRIVYEVTTEVCNNILNQ